nr:ankyrin repeat [Pandoravirus massiliensis]
MCGKCQRVFKKNFGQSHFDKSAPRRRRRHLSALRVQTLYTVFFHIMDDEARRQMDKVAPHLPTAVARSDQDDGDLHPFLCHDCAHQRPLDAPRTLKRRRDHDLDERTDSNSASALGTAPIAFRGARVDGTVIGVVSSHKRARVDRALDETHTRIANEVRPTESRPSDDQPFAPLVSISLVSLPVETVRSIVGFLNDRDYYSCMLASSLFHVCNHHDVLLRRYATRDIFDSNETLADIAFVRARQRRLPALPVIVKAASRGRHDIVMYTVRGLGARAAIPSWEAPKPDAGSPDIRACVKDALYAALNGDHRRVVVALARHYGFSETIAATGLMTHAARIGRLNAVEAFHGLIVAFGQRRQAADVAAGRPPRAFDPHVACRRGAVYNIAASDLAGVGEAAWQGEHVHVLDWLLNRQCPGAYVPDRHSLAFAVSTGRVVLARWAASKMGQRAAVGRRDIDNAAAHGHVATVRWAHESKLRRCSVSTIEMAARSGKPGCVDVLRWAAGDGTRPAAVPEWRDARVAVLAACAGHLNIIQWLYEHHRECVTPEAARCAARAGHVDVVRFLHEKGVAPVTHVNLLGRAVKSRNVKLVDAIAAAGAHYKPSALVFATRCKLNDIVAVLCRRYAHVIDPDEAMRVAGREAAYKIARAIMADLPGACLERARESIPPGRSAKALGKCLCRVCKPAPAPDRRAKN